MSSKYVCSLLPVWVLLLSASTSCRSSSTEKEHNMPQSFEIIFNVSTSLYCAGISYTITEKSIDVDIEERPPRANNAESYQQSDCDSKKVFKKELVESEDLVQISNIHLEDLEAIPHEERVTGITYTVTLKKNGKTKQIVYMGGTKWFGRETKRIVKFINSQVPRQYRIDL